MNISVGNPLAAPLLGDIAQEAAAVQAPAQANAHGAVVAVQGPALNGAIVGAGNGQARQAALGGADRAKAFFAALGQPFKALGEQMRSMGTSISNIFNHAAREQRLDAKYRLDNAGMVRALGQPMGQHSIARNEAVMTKVFQHARDMGCDLDPRQLRQLVATGERLAAALQADIQGSGNSPLTVLDNDGNAHQVSSGIHTTRSLSWYMMSVGALQDVAREAAGIEGHGSMPTNGSFVMKDPGNRTYNFLSQAPTAASRMSSHFNERSDVSRDPGVLGFFTNMAKRHLALGFIPTFKPAQRGIEDYRNMLPGQGGAMLFDKLRAGDGSKELFVKFEHGGCPPYFGGLERHEGFGAFTGRFFGALVRNVGHAFSFASTRGADGAVEGRRQEHVYKGVLKNTVHMPFKELVQNAKRSGLDLGASSRAISNNVEKFGMPTVHAMVQQIADQAQDGGHQAIVDQARELQDNIRSEMKKLGIASDQYDIERRGAEVHISLDPALHPL